jgi:hypothetical protein
MTAPTSYGLGLPGMTLTDLWGFLEEIEGFRSPPNGPGEVYNDAGTGSKGNPTIGYGFNLTESGQPPSTNSLGATLDQLIYTVTLGTGSGAPVYSGNVFQVAYLIASANDQMVPSVQQILQYFEQITQSVKLTPGQPANYVTLQNELNWALQSFFLGLGPQLVSNPFALPTAAPLNANWVSNVAFSFGPLAAGESQAQLALTNLVQGNVINEQGSGGALTINGKSPALWTLLSGAAGTYTDPITGQQDINGAPPGSDQWEALVAAYYQGGLGSVATLASGLRADNPALDWFDLRYLANTPLINPNSNLANGFASRNYLQSALFGINGGSSESALTLAFQDYQVLTQYRSTIISYEQKFGDDPDGVNPQRVIPGSALFSANTELSKIGPSDKYGAPGATIPANLQSPIQALAQTFAGEEQQIITYLQQIPLLANIPTLGTFATSTNVFVASSAQSTVDAAIGDLTPYTPSGDIADSSAEAYANHIIVGYDSGETLIGGLGSDIIVAGSGNETLISGLGNDTIVAGVAAGGSDTIDLRGADDTVDFEITNQTNVTETISDNGSVGSAGAVDLNGLQITGSTAAPVSGSGNSIIWNGVGSGYTYTFTRTAADVSIGSLTITGGGLSAGTNSIVIQNFNLQQAVQNSSGFLGISLQNSASINYTANAGGGPVDSGLVEGSNQSFTLSTIAPSNVAQSFEVTLSGAAPGDFEALVGKAGETLSASGTFAVTLAAGDTNVAFTLQDITADNGSTDIAGGAALQLTASLPNLANPTGPAIQTAPLTFAYFPTKSDSGVAPSPTNNITGTYNGGTGITTYLGDGGNDYIAAGAGPNFINATNSIGDSIFGGSGSNTIYGGSGNDVISLAGSQDLVSLGGGFNTLTGGSGKDTIYANNATALISGNNDTDIIIAGNGTNAIYAGTQTSLATAIASASSGTATGQQGDLIAVADGSNTVVGGQGNDLIVAGAGNDVIVMG